MTEQKVLIVEDDKKIADILTDYLEMMHFTISVLDQGSKVAQTVKLDPPDLVILDVMLPGKDGMTVCSEIRSFSNVPIIMLTAKVEEIDRLLGLELGADDYICKPFSPREVVSRVKAVLRRSQIEPREERLIAGPITIDSHSHRVMIGETNLNLTPNEFNLLKIMAARPGHVFTRSDLVCKMQGDDYEGCDRTIDSHIKNLRKKNRGDPSGEGDHRNGLWCRIFI